MTHGVEDAGELLRREQERAAQLETYAADLSRTYRELRSHLQHLTVLHEVNTRIAAALDPEQVVAGVLDSLGQLLSYRTAAIFLLDLEDTSTLGGSLALADPERRPRLRARRTAATTTPLDVAERSLAPADSVVIQAMRQQHTVGRPLSDGSLALAVPLKAGGRALGALELELSEALTDESVKLIELLAAGAAVALQNAYLYQQTQRLATTDALTGLSNYRHFHDLLSLEVQRARRMGYPVGLVMMDLDHFKNINDRHGHPTGDVALKLVAEQLRKYLRRTDVVGRLGGEEFAAILPGDKLDAVAVVAEKLRLCVERLPPVRGGMVSTPSYLTLSLGGTSLDHDHVDAERLVSFADQALYEAKRRGRNQVRLWTGPHSPHSDPTEDRRGPEA
jgi:diguanylate cyclase (GGDEF)-like protein